MSNLIESDVENVALGLGKNPSTMPFFLIPSLSHRFRCEYLRVLCLFERDINK